MHEPVERHGGAARIRRLEEGTEVILELPVDAPDTDESAPDNPATTPTTEGMHR